MLVAVCCAYMMMQAGTDCKYMLPASLFICKLDVQNGGGPNGDSPDGTRDNTKGTQEMDRLSTPVLAGTVHRSQADLDL